MQKLDSTPPASPAWSPWERDVFPHRFDLAVIGGGLVGLSAAISALERKPGLRIAVLERGAWPSGASTRNAGFACFGSMTELLADTDHMGATASWRLVEDRWNGLQHLRRRLDDSAISLQLEGGYELFGPADAEVYARCMAHLDEFNERLQPITGLKETFVRADGRLASFGFSGVEHLIYNRAEGQLHPGRLMAALCALARKQGVQLLNGLEVLDWWATQGGYELVCRAERPLWAARVLVANNGFAARLLPGLELQPARNQVLLTRPVPGGLPWRGCFHYRQGYIYFRNVGDRILLGGARDLDPDGERTDEFGNHSGIREALDRFLKEVLAPGLQVEPEHCWSGILGVGPRKEPLVKEVQPGLFTAVRLSGMGIALGSQLGERIARQMFPGR